MIRLRTGSTIALSGVLAVGVSLALAAPAAAHTTSAGSDHSLQWHGKRGHSHSSKPAINVVASGFNGASSIAFGANGKLFVAEAAIGQITKVDLKTGAHTAFATNIQGLSGLDVGRGGVYATQGYIPETQSAPATAPLIKVRSNGSTKVVADLLKYELKHNPDGQFQGADPLHPAETDDSLSNPFAVLDQGFRVLVADAGANDVLAVSPHGKVTTFFAPRNITTGACAGAPNNDAQHPGCDPVPTGLAVGPNGDIYVSGLGAEAPNAARVWQLDKWTGHVKRVWGDLTDATGVAVGNDGSVYVSELFYGQDPEDPNADPSKAGRIVKIAPNGKRTYAPVHLPAGLTINCGTLYATQFSVLDLFGPPSAQAQVVTVSKKAFAAGPRG
ncbi:MAG: hypothetical protein JWN95_3747 [Frankiales bacterium]|nr:hypothetical protein [Frankiales bacterium]